MALRRYEISLRVLKTLEVREEKFRISKRPCNVLKYKIISVKHFFSCERRDLLCSLSNGDILTCKDNLLFSHVKISCFRAKAHLVFHWYLYNKQFVRWIALSKV